MARLKDVDQVINSRRRLSELRPDALAGELKRIFDELSLLSQDDAHSKAAAAEYADQVISPSILRHRDKSIRILSACCAANILRIYAPEAPYDTQQLEVNDSCITSRDFSESCCNN